MMTRGLGLTVREISRKSLFYVFAAAVGGWFYFFRFGVHQFIPTSYEWMFASGDPATFFIGWQYFRHEAWSWPPGLIHGYFAPIGTSIAIVDALPLLAIPLKLFHSWLPENFQYFGIWTFICYCLQAVFGYLLAGHVTSNKLGRYVIMLFFLLCPAFLGRFGHIALASHWTMLAALALYFRGIHGTMRFRIVAWCLLVILVSFIHPYLTAMVCGIALATWLRSASLSGGRMRAISASVPVGLACLVILSFWCAGIFIYYGETGPGPGIFGRFSMNLNSLYNPMNSSQFLVSRPLVSGEQWEGYNYAGLGFLFLALIGVATAVPSGRLVERIRRHTFLFALLVLFFLFALSNKVTWDNHVVFEYSLPQFLDPLLVLFRSSGRFFWPVVYVMMLAVFWWLAHFLDRKSFVFILAVGIIIQVADLKPLFDISGNFKMRFDPNLQNEKWEQAFAQADTVYFIPPFQYTFQEEADFREFGRIGARFRVPITAGYVARVPVGPTQKIEGQLSEIVRQGLLNPHGFYVVQKSDFARALAASQPRGWSGDCWDGYYVLVSPESGVEVEGKFGKATTTEIGDFLQSNRENSILLSVKDEAREHLNDNDIRVFEELGFKIGNLGYKTSFVGVWSGGRVVFEKYLDGENVEVTFSKDIPVNGWHPVNDMRIVSGGFSAANVAIIEIDGENAALGGTGFNVVVLNESGKIIQVGTFNTNLGEPGYVVEIN